MNLDMRSCMTQIFKVFLVALLLLPKLSIHLVQAGTESVTQSVGKLVHFSIKNTLNKRLRHHMNSIFTAIMRESTQFNFDPVLLLSIIKVESGFVVNMRGRYGEIGLMQIKPSTGRWVAKKFGFPWNGKKTLENPELNIRIGTAYLSLLRDVFPKQEQLYLSAYNMGANNVFKSVRKNVIPKDYASRIQEQYQTYYSKIRYKEA